MLKYRFLPIFSLVISLFFVNNCQYVDDFKTTVMNKINGEEAEKRTEATKRQSNNRIITPQVNKKSKQSSVSVYDLNRNKKTTNTIPLTKVRFIQFYTQFLNYAKIDNISQGVALWNKYGLSEEKIESFFENLTQSSDDEMTITEFKNKLKELMQGIDPVKIKEYSSMVASHIEHQR